MTTPEPAKCQCYACGEWLIAFIPGQPDPRPDGSAADIITMYEGPVGSNPAFHGAIVICTPCLRKTSPRNLFDQHTWDSFDPKVPYLKLPDLHHDESGQEWNPTRHPSVDVLMVTQAEIADRLVALAVCQASTSAFADLTPLWGRLLSVGTPAVQAVMMETLAVNAWMTIEDPETVTEQSLDALTNDPEAILAAGRWLCEWFASASFYPHAPRTAYRLLHGVKGPEVFE